VLLKKIYNNTDGISLSTLRSTNEEKCLFWHYRPYAGFSMGLISCVTNKVVTNIEIALSAEGTPEGIRLKFAAIPADITRVFVAFNDVSGNKNPIDGPQTFADIRGNALEQLKVSGTLICPFTQEGHEYTIIAFFSKDGMEYPTSTVTTTAVGGMRPRSGT
jgi:hypothetical protein